MTVEQIRSLLQHEFINITDMPTGQVGAYQYLPADDLSVRDYRGAAVGLLNAAHTRLFWSRLGTSVAMHRVARCHGCAAFAAQKLRYSGIPGRILIAGVPASDHHVCIVSPTGEPHAPGSVTVDLWLYNGSRIATGGRNLEELAAPFESHIYTRYGAENLKVYCRFN